MPVGAMGGVHVVDVPVIVGIVFYTNLVIRTGISAALEIQKASCVVHLVIHARCQQVPVQIDPLRARHHRKVTTVVTDGVAFPLAAHAVHHPDNAVGLVCARHAADFGIASPEPNHGPKASPFQPEQAHVPVPPNQVAQVHHPVPGLRTKVYLVHFLQGGGGLVTGTAVHVRKQSVYIDAVAYKALYRKPQLLIHLGTAIAHRHLHGLVTVSGKPRNC